VTATAAAITATTCQRDERKRRRRCVHEGNFSAHHALPQWLLLLLLPLLRKVMITHRCKEIYRGSLYTA